MQTNRNSEASARRVPVFFAQIAVRIVAEIAAEKQRFATDLSMLCSCLAAPVQSTPESGFL